MNRIIPASEILTKSKNQPAGSIVTRLIIDDEKTFTKLAPEGVEYARSCKEGLAKVKNPAGWWNEIWLDFDLGDDDCMPIVNFLEECARDDSSESICDKIICCSMNPVGRELIKTILGRWYEVVEILPWEYL